jgi:hypothetical protein
VIFGRGPALPAHGASGPDPQLYVLLPQTKFCARALPGAVPVSDRCHLWQGLGEAARKEVAAHSACWARGTPLQDGKRASTTLERWQQVRELRARNVGLLACARRLSLSLNTVKRYDRASEPERLQRVPKGRTANEGQWRHIAAAHGGGRPPVPLLN